MASNRAEIREHINSITQTRKTTDAMQLISGVMFAKQMACLERVGSYAREVRRVTRDALANCEDIEHPYLGTHVEGKRYVLYIGGDLGMCGAYNGNITRFLTANVPPTVELHVLGLNQYRMIEAEGYTIANEPVASAELVQDDLKLLADEALERFASRELHQVDLLYTRYVNPVTFKPMLTRLLPLGAMGEDEDPPGYVYLEPDPAKLVESLVRLMVETSFYSAFVESGASEQAARKLAMKNATDNANDLLDELTLQYNQIRQDEITQEISEIVGGADAL